MTLLLFLEKAIASMRSWVGSTSNYLIADRSTSGTAPHAKLDKNLATLDRNVFAKGRVFDYALKQLNKFNKFKQLNKF